jgi:hypothetical protein
MNFLIQTLLLPLVVFAHGATNIPSLQKKPVKFTVLDHKQHPVEGARIEASRSGSGNEEGMTDDSGKATLQLSAGSTLYLYVSKDGYYDTGGELWTGGIHRKPSGRMAAREIPDSFTVELKPVMDPVALKRTKFRGRAPDVAGPIPFDLELSDWVEPYGRGVSHDILFQFQDILIEPEAFNGTMILSFPNNGDGIQSFQAARPFSMEFGSNHAPPLKAPVNGYQPSLRWSLSHTEGEPYKSYKVKQRNYLLRTRTVTDASGTIRQACYGWIEGEIEFDPRDPKGPQLVFTCYFNPNPHPEARSLEHISHVPVKH